MGNKMTALIDTGIFIAFNNTKDVNHNRALTLVREIVEGKHGAAFTTDYIFDEAVTTALVRTGKHKIAIELGNQILGVNVKFVNIIQVDLASFSQAWKLFNKYIDKKLSFIDCISIAVIENYGLNKIVSFDKDFDGIVPRLS
jgi:predicted nucleic acid-binding protein